MFQRFVERFDEAAQALGNRTPHDGADDRVQRLDKHLGLLFERGLDGAFDTGLERADQFLAALTAELDRLRQNARHLADAPFFVVQSFSKFAKLLPFAAQQQNAKFFEAIHRIFGD